eukprot:CAMPEP_0169096784 /NCGR_PEP_ID=MMETSP1015-20121227/19178_1 /TAXON_ID=342587 /ORGANISM="Karlodinium micrum, Strain CCMP2283" /LENGTH=190 /DNA_ID=CAMNT_0009157561 /DNA_START=142 /DNA_END=714 /DNA_ORIENTATION=+
MATARPKIQRRNKDSAMRTQGIGVSREKMGALAGDVDYAVVEASGRQWIVQPDCFYDFDKMPLARGDTFNLNKVLLLKQNGKVAVGRPYLEGVKVGAQVLGDLKGKNVKVFKMKPKKGYRRTYNHRAHKTRVLITEMETSDSTKWLDDSVPIEVLQERFFKRFPEADKRHLQFGHKSIEDLLEATHAMDQ